MALKLSKLNSLLKRGFSTKTKPQAQVEATEDLFAQMAADMNDIASSHDHGPQAHVSQQKGDVVYIMNPSSTWRFGRVVNMNDQRALLLSLHQRKAIALLLDQGQAEN